MTFIDKETAQRGYYLSELSTTDVAVTSGERLTRGREFFLSELTLTSGNRQDLERDWLAAQAGVTKTNTGDMWKQYLNLAGYTGDVETMKKQFYIDNS